VITVGAAITAVKMSRMVQPVVVICAVGLTPGHLGPDTPHLQRLAADGFAAPLTSVIPAVTTTAQTSLLTGVLPQEHGIVANGWHFRDQGEIWFWRQSQALVQAPLCWQTIRESRPELRVLKHFWWYAMNTDVSATVTPRPIYHHDGRKGPDIYAWPYSLKDELIQAHGQFPLFHFWGPTASIRSTRWIADSFVTAFARTQADLAFCYLPHLDYDLQRLGPTGAHLGQNLRDLDTCVGIVVEAARARGARIVVVSEYGIERVDQAVFINRALREAGLLSAVDNAAGELLDVGVSRAFAVCDHQIAHVSCRDAQALTEAQQVLSRLPGIERVYAGAQRSELGLDHPRSGELVALAAPGAWFAYDYWLDPARRPDFADCVEIHKKPGYDPRELAFAPGGKRRAGLALLRKKLGLRYRMAAVGSDPSVVRGSHGRPASSPAVGPVIIGSDRAWNQEQWSQLDVAPLLVGLLR